MATKGTVWVLRRSTDLVPALVGMAVREWLTGRGAAEETGPQDVAAIDMVSVSEISST